ncbi:unnamed protein product [Trichogramma brassicae]|uniref:Reverse transcriptase domain-containing protein n=1 Tax=Trichogramma brassicae TaxID=86971 RepID=A0A6H5J0A0_9HYME|nr:unnamed protein product [Trichogramma brassicae]
MEFQSGIVLRDLEIRHSFDRMCPKYDTLRCKSLHFSAQHFWRSRYRAGGSNGDKLSWLVVSSFSAKMLDVFILRRVGAAARKVSRAIADARRTTIALSRRAAGRTPTVVAEADEVCDGSDRPGVHGRTEMTRGMRRSSCSLLSMLSVIVMSGAETVTGIPVTRTSQESTLVTSWKVQVPVFQIKNIRIVTETRTTTTWQDSMTAIMDSCFGPSEKVESNHALPMPDPLDQNSATEWTDIEVIGAIRSMKSNKAPGLDMVEVEFSQALGSVGGAVGPLTMLYNACRRCGYFPETWKTANVRVLIKGPDKDPTHPKSYRPICLLSVLSKVLERLICWRLKETMERPQFTSNRQFGFRVGGGY